MKSAGCGHLHPHAASMDGSVDDLAVARGHRTPVSCASARRQGTTCSGLGSKRACGDVPPVPGCHRSPRPNRSSWRMRSRRLDPRKGRAVIMDRMGENPKHPASHRRHPPQTPLHGQQALSCSSAAVMCHRAPLHLTAVKSMLAKFTHALSIRPAAVRLRAAWSASPPHPVDYQASHTTSQITRLMTSCRRREFPW